MAKNVRGRYQVIAYQSMAHGHHGWLRNQVGSARWAWLAKWRARLHTARTNEDTEVQDTESGLFIV